MANPPAGHPPSPTHKTVPQALRQLVERLGLSRRFAFPVATVVVAAVLAAVLVDGPTDDLAGDLADELAEPAAAERGPSGQPLPRFVSLAAGEANLRTGPGRRYPILWVYVRRRLPVEITAEYGQWRRIRDAEGTRGWVHSSLLSSTRTALIVGETRTLFADPDPQSRPVLRAEAGVIGALEKCRQGWCRLKVGGKRGWLPAGHVWGVTHGQP